MATKLFLRNTTTNGITGSGDGILYDLSTTAGSSSDTAVTNTSAGGTEIQLTKTAGGSTIAWISGRVPSGGFTLTTTDISLWQQESATQANIGGRLRIFKRAANGTITELGGGPFDDGVEMNTANREDTWVANPTDTAFAEDDRILIRLYLTNIGTMGGGRTGTLTFNAADAATGDSFFNINETVSFKANDISVALTGVSSTLSAGSLAVSRDKALTGNAVTGSVGTVTPQSGLWSAAINFRATSTYVTDGAGQTYAILTDTFPTGRGGLTFGWESTPGLDSRDRSTSVDVKLAGLHFHVNSDTNTDTFRLTLPYTGTFRIRLACGDAGGNPQTNYLIVKDDTTAFITFAPLATSSSEFGDAAGNKWSAANWPGSNVSVDRTFTSTILRVTIGGTIDSASSTIVHLSVDEVATSDVTVALTGVSTTSALGTLSQARDATLSGASSTASVGSVGVSRDKSITGASSTASVGALTPNADKAISGNASSFTLGSLTPDHQQSLTGAQLTTSTGLLSPDRLLELSGVNSTSALEVVTQSFTISITGVESSAVVGAVTIEGSSDRQAALTSVHSTTALGSVDVDRSLTLNGAESVSEIGTLTPEPLILVSGNELSGSIGSVAQSVSITLNGAQVTGEAGTLSVSSSLALSGVFTTGQTGSVAAESDTSLSLQLSGVTASCSLGGIVLQRDAALAGVETVTALDAVGFSKSGGAVLTGVQASALAGSLTVELARAVDGNQAQAQVGDISLLFGVTPSGVMAIGGAGSLAVSVDLGLSGVVSDLQLGSFLLVGSIARRKIIQVSSEGRSARVSTERRSLRVSSETRIK